MQVILHDNAGGDDTFPADNTSKAYYNWYWLICQIAEEIADIPENVLREVSDLTASVYCSLL